MLVDDPQHPQLPALREAGVDVVLVPAGALVGALVAAQRERAVDGSAPVGLPAPGDGDLPARLSALAPGVAVEVLVGSQDRPGDALLDAVAVMDRLRSPGGCPWDAAQTAESLRPYLLEEAYEALQALEDGDPAAVREELGDVLLQVLFHARLAQEAEPAWSVDDVARGLVDKLVRRHPHVFAGASSDDLEGSWDAIKAEEGRRSVTDGVPLGQPALSLAAALQRRARRLGAPVPAYDGPGGALWELVGASVRDRVDAEQALRAVARGFRDALAAVEHAVRDEGRDPARLSEQEWRERWPYERATGRPERG